MKLAKSRVHFIGIGGIGMCGLAELLHNMGTKVTGSDISENHQTQHLTDMGIKISIGHLAENIFEKDVVVYSSAIKFNNIEYRTARKLKIPLIGRAEALAEMMHLKRGIAVAGTHGKTTTTSLAASVFLAADKDPTIIVGGRVDLIKSTAQLGKGDWLIAEADESDGSFRRLFPEICVITNIDNDHLDFYQTFANLKEAFVDFASRIPFYGCLIACGDDQNIRQLFQDFPKKVIFYGFGSENDSILKDIGDHTYRLYLHGDEVGKPFKVAIQGRHNALNAQAALLCGLTAGLNFESSVKGVAEFQGVDRRFQFKGEKNGVDHYDDYAHHPTEVKAVLNSFKSYFPDKRLVVLFQPHRYSRMEICWEEFLESFTQADIVYVLDVYPAGEAPIEGINSKRLTEELKHNNCMYLPNKDIAPIKPQLKEGDILLTLGAGDVWKFSETLYST